MMLEAAYNLLKSLSVKRYTLGTYQMSTNSQLLVLSGMYLHTYMCTCKITFQNLVQQIVKINVVIPCFETCSVVLCFFLIVYDIHFLPLEPGTLLL